MKQRKRNCLVLAGICLLAAQARISAQPENGVASSVMHPSGFAVSPPLRGIDDVGTDPDSYVKPLAPQHIHGHPKEKPVPGSSVVQSTPGPPSSAAHQSLFPGVGANGFAPSDANLAVGPNHVVQVVNTRYAVYDKSGNVILGPLTLGSIWGSQLPSCSGSGGDTVVQYDKAGDRWLITQLASTSAPYGECIAVSQTGDPTGVFHLYFYSYGSNLNDYPKFSVWPTATNSAYLATYNLFQDVNGNYFFVGGQLCAYDRAEMMAGNANATAICETISNDASFLPADPDGPGPPDGTPAIFMTLETTSSLRTYTLAPNFAAGTATLVQVSPDISVATFTEACNGGTCIPQAPASTGTAAQLDSLGDRPMYRTPFRVFPNHWTILMSHSVDVGGTAGERWYELRSTTGASGFTLYQQGTFSPDSTYRWMGSIAMDQSGDIGLGYSASSSTIHPSIRYTGRVPTDPLGTMEAETSMLVGTGSQTGGLTRWGDYTALRIDPSDDCTFWYTDQYEAADGSFNWSTFIGSFKFAACGAPPTPDFAVSANPSAVTVTQGGAAGTSLITVSSISGFSSSVSLTVSHNSISGCPTGLTCIFIPSSTVTPPANSAATATLSVTALANAPVGPVTLTITGTDGTAGPHSTTVTVTVNAATPDFTISASPTSLSITRGNSGSVTVTATSLGANTNVTLSASGLPSKTSASFNPEPVTATGTGGKSTMTITTNRKSPTGTVTVTITGTNGTDTHHTTIQLTLH